MHGKAGNGAMKLHGTLEHNLSAAIRSAKRLHGQRVHADTIDFWQALLRHAGWKLQNGLGPETVRVQRLVAELRREMAER